MSLKTLNINQSDMIKDVIIIGAGLSGIGAACHLAINNPDKSYLILEGRANFGGTWDLFKYPGIRSDSNMYTFGYSFKPWESKENLADAEDIMSYLKASMEEYDVEDKIVYHQKVTKTQFSKQTGLWTISVTNTQTGEQIEYKSKMVFSCCGYYSYDKGYTPDFAGMNDFKGQIIHPQHWPEDLDYSNKKVVVIGSGATAITLIPNMADKTETITMLQRSPSYVGALPNNDEIADYIKSLFPSKMAYNLIRFKNITLDMLFYNACIMFPEQMKKFLTNAMQKELGDFPVEPHFKPRYNPWEQRFCLAPDGDFFKVLREGKADVVTDTIKTFTEKGILLDSGKELEADIVVTATGLNLLPFGGIDLYIEEEKINLPDKHLYKGCALEDVPNALFFVGYTNASWTLKSDLTSEYASRMINYLDINNYDYFMPTSEGDIGERPALDMESGYIKRAIGLFPRQGAKRPWRLAQNFVIDYFTLRVMGINDEAMEFGRISNKAKQSTSQPRQVKNVTD